MLPRMHLPLTARGFGVLRAVQVLMSLAVVGGIGAALSFTADSRDRQGRALPYETATNRIIEITGTYMKEAKLAGHDLSDERLKNLDAEVSFTNQMVAKRAFSWTRFLRDLEEAVPPRVSIGSVGLSFKDGVSTISLTGSALALRDLTALVNGLEGHSAFRQVVLSHHQTQGPPEKPGDQSRDVEGARQVEFSLTVTYRPPL
jgi:hypothetical protein